MFWSEDELKEIKGTSIEGRNRSFSSLGSAAELILLCIHSFLLEKIGRTEAEKDYHEKLIPALQVYYFSTFLPEEFHNDGINLG